MSRMTSPDRLHIPTSALPGRLPSWGYSTSINTRRPVGAACDAARTSLETTSALPAMLRTISTTSVAIELDQPLVADPEVMRDLVEHDMPDLAA